MIKNHNQLRRASARLQGVRQQIEDLQDRFGGMELDILKIPLIQETQELETEIMEYRELLQLSLEEAVQGPLRESMLLENVGELLAKLRISSGLTQEELAARLGWQQPNLSRFESENYHSQTVARIVEYAGCLGIWLHISPSLTEEQTEVIYRSEKSSTSTAIFGHGLITDSPVSAYQPGNEDHTELQSAFFRNVSRELVSV